ncbi:peroxin 10 [Artemisia annua]|uniref:RING-type E3 ubiquitin transferase n=1 Tax=Artemisia annua TaxID=35608 RepID=A0A2U1LIE8_ARTAN|nr:peroxin 10 [Artemisia annua]
MGNEIGESSGKEDAGTTALRRRFSLAAQPEMMRAAQKDDQYASFVYEACRDAFRHLFGAGQQTLGEEYCDITQVAGSYGLPPTPARHALFIVYQSAVPYIAERVSSRIALSESLSDELETYGSTQDWLATDQASSSSPIVSSSPFSRLKSRISGLWLNTVQRWPAVLPLAREFLQLLLRTNLMFFYFEDFSYLKLFASGDLGSPFRGLGLPDVSWNCSTLFFLLRFLLLLIVSSSARCGICSGPGRTF